MACHPVRVTGYVDDELSGSVDSQVTKHVATCAVCAAQALFETALRRRLCSAADVPMPPIVQRRILARAFRLQ